MRYNVSIEVEANSEMDSMGVALSWLERKLATPEGKLEVLGSMMVERLQEPEDFNIPIISPTALVDCPDCGTEL